MAKPITSMTTREFAKATGIPAATVSKLIRDGKLKAKKEGNSWRIASSQLKAKAVLELEKPATPAKGKKAAKPALAPKAARPANVAAARPAAPLRPVAPATAAPAPAAAPAPVPSPTERAYTVAESGRLMGRQEAGGQWVVFESNLQVPDISRLVRK